MTIGTVREDVGRKGRNGPQALKKGDVSAHEPAVWRWQVAVAAPYSNADARAPTKKLDSEGRNEDRTAPIWPPRN